MDKKELYNLLINQGKSHNEAIDTVIDFFTNGLSASWERDTWEQAREAVEIIILKSI